MAKIDQWNGLFLPNFFIRQILKPYKPRSVGRINNPDGTGLFLFIAFLFPRFGFYNTVRTKNQKNGGNNNEKFFIKALQTLLKYLEDIYRRIGNQIIGAVRVIVGREKKTGNRLARKRIRRRTVLGIMEYAIGLNCEIERDAMEAFDEFLERLENADENLSKITVKGGSQSEME